MHDQNWGYLRMGLGLIALSCLYLAYLLGAYVHGAPYLDRILGVLVPVLMYSCTLVDGIARSSEDRRLKLLSRSLFAGALLVIAYQLLTRMVQELQVGQVKTVIFLIVAILVAMVGARVFIPLFRRQHAITNVQIALLVGVPGLILGLVGWWAG